MFIPKATFKDKSPDMDGLLRELDFLLSQDWGSSFTYDVAEAKRTSVVKLLYAETNAPVPLKMPLTGEAFNNLEFGRRELQRKIKDCLPSSILDFQISKVNNILRNSNRRALKSVRKDYSNWINETVQLLYSLFPKEVVETWKNKSSAPIEEEIKNDLHALQAEIRQKIEALQEL